MTKKRVYTTLPAASIIPLSSCKSKPNIDFKFFDSIPNLIDSTEARIDCEVLWIGLNDPVRKNEIDALQNLKFLATSTTGTTHVDEEYLGVRNISLISLRDKTANLNRVTATSELCWGLFLAAHRQILLADRNHHYTVTYRDTYNSSQISNSNIGIVGFGRIGKQIAHFANAFNARVFYDDVKEIGYTKIAAKESLDWIAEHCDSIFVSASISKDLAHPLINREVFSKFQRKPILVNISRGSLVDEKAAIEALEEGRIRAYATDVISDEEVRGQGYLTPETISHHIKKGLNLIVTPHIGGSSSEALLIVNDFIFQEIILRLNEV